MKRFRQIAIGTFVFAAVLCGLVGCNTLHGVGEDIEEGGERIQDATEE